MCAIGWESSDDSFQFCSRALRLLLCQSIWNTYSDPGLNALAKICELIFLAVHLAEKRFKGNCCQKCIGETANKAKLEEPKSTRIASCSDREASRQCVIVENLVNDWALMIFMITLDLYRSLQKRNRNKFWFLFTVKRLN